MIETLYPKNLSSGKNQLDLYSPSESARHYVLYSGGCDSTLLLYEALQQYGPDKVVAISCTFPWLQHHKMIHEIEARKRFLKTLPQELQGFDTININVGWDVTANTKEHRTCLYASGLLQAYSWITSVLPFLHPNDWLYIGTIRGDDLITLCFREFCNMFEGCLKLLEREVHLCMPYVALNKSDVISKLIEYGFDESVWFCEQPVSDTSEPCTNCKPCKTHIAALSQIIVDPDISKDVQSKAALMLNKLLSIHAKTTKTSK